MNQALNGKSKAELLQIAAGRGITGLDGQTVEMIAIVIENDMVEKSEVLSRQQLNAMSVTDLLTMAEKNGMSGLGKQPKAILVELLIAHFTRVALAAVSGTFTVTKADDGCVNTKIVVTCGTNKQDLEDTIGHTVQEVFNLLSGAFNISAGSKALVNGTTEVAYDYVLTSNDLTLEFTKPADRKG